MHAAFWAARPPISTFFRRWGENLKTESHLLYLSNEHRLVALPHVMSVVYESLEHSSLSTCLNLVSAVFTWSSCGGNFVAAG